MRRAALAGALLFILCANARPLSAQTPVGRVDLGVGVAWFGSAQFPEVVATETTPGGGRNALFRSKTSLDASAGLGVHAGVRVTKLVAAEVTVSLNRTGLSTEVTDDAEGAADITASELVTQYLIEGGVRLRPARWRSARLERFVSAGGGYLRQLHEGQTLLQTGRSWYVGAGANYLLKADGKGWIRSSGLRLDVRASILDGGVAVDRGWHAVPGLAGGLFVRF